MTTREADSTLTVGPTQEVARFALETAAIPRDVREEAINHIIDGVGVMLAGTTEESGPLVRGHLQEMAGRGQATVLGSRLRAPAQFAAWANGVAGHALDYDDTQLATDPRSVYGLLTHPTIPVLSAVIAFAETAGNVSGAQLMEAYTLGLEVECRIADAIAPRHYQEGFHSTATMGGLGAACAVARLAGCDLDQTLRALGLAASMSAGLRENFGTMTKPFHAGRAAESGVLAVLLARRGWTSAKNILEADRGFFRAAGGGFDKTKIAGKLGQPYFFTEPGVSIKPYPSGSLSHPAQDVLLELVSANNVRPDDVERVDVGVNSNVPNALIYSHPTTALEAKFSLQFQMAIGVLDRAAGLAQFTDDKVREPRTQALMKRVFVHVDPEIEALGFNEMRMNVEIVLKDGQRFSGRADKATGHPQKPMSREDVKAKFRECARLVLKEGQANELLSRLEGIESLKDISLLTPYLSGPLV
jgi:2-methylcitrate dehydratase PrpD